jgi:hypothetical protein
MSDHHDPDLDARLADLLSDAVSDVEPGERLDQIRTRTKASPMSSRRPWLLAVGGAVVATAAVITAIALATGGSTPPSTEPGPATTPPSVAVDTPSPSDASPSPAGETFAAGIYYVGDTPVGPRLYREFARVPADGGRLMAALEQATRTPRDPDYRTLWPEGSFASASFDGIGADGQYSVTIADPALRDHPEAMTEDEARMAVEAVIYTLQAAGQARAPVQFYLAGNPVDQVYGVPTSEALSNGPVLDTLSHVSLTTPEEGAVVRGDTLEVTGVASSFEANVVARLQRYEGTEVMAQVPFTAEGWMGEKLFPFSGEIDISGVPAGRYILMVMTDDPSGGAEGNGAFTDTRIIEVR